MYCSESRVTLREKCLTPHASAAVPWLAVDHVTMPKTSGGKKCRLRTLGHRFHSTIDERFLTFAASQMTFAKAQNSVFFSALL